MLMRSFDSRDSPGTEGDSLRSRERKAVSCGAAFSTAVKLRDKPEDLWMVTEIGESINTTAGFIEEKVNLAPLRPSHHQIKQGGRSSYYCRSVELVQEKLKHHLTPI